jgi:hypothetical protein
MSSRNLIISVYKTSISEKDMETLKPVLDRFNKVIKWNTDLEDLENILRVESNHAITNMLNTLNIACIALV